MNLRFEEFVERQPQTIYVSATPGKYEYAQTQTIVEQVVRPTGLLDPQIDIRSALLQVDDVLGEIKNRVKQKQRILIVLDRFRHVEEVFHLLLRRPD